LQDVDLYKLLVVFQNALDKYHIEKNKPKHEIYRYPYTISEQKKFLINLIKSKSKISFINLIEKNPLKILVIFNFLAILELIQESKVKLSIGQGLNNFWITDLS
jgi:segregation and condensation protein A